VIHAHYRHVFTASGSPAPSFHVSAGALPPGLSLDAATNVLEGAPTTLGTYAFTVAASNGTLPDATQAVTLVVRSAIYMPLIRGEAGQWPARVERRVLGVWHQAHALLAFGELRNKSPSHNEEDGR